MSLLTWDYDGDLFCALTTESGVKARWHISSSARPAWFPAEPLLCLLHDSCDGKAQERRAAAWQHSGILGRHHEFKFSSFWAINGKRPGESVSGK
jgi:hypothetical protein